MTSESPARPRRRSWLGLLLLLPGALGTAFGFRRLTGPLVGAGFRALAWRRWSGSWTPFVRRRCSARGSRGEERR